MNTNPDRDRRHPLRVANDEQGLLPTPTVTWEDFLRTFQWNQGEHVTMIGTTGSGKTTLLRKILVKRSHVVIFGVKGRDDSMEKFIRQGYTKIKSWNQHMVDNHLVLWPEIRGVGHMDLQRQEFGRAMDAIFRQGGWCTVFDEVSYMSDNLKLDAHLKFLLQQGRSSGISVVGMTQRPAWIPLAFYDQASHLFIFHDNDHRNVKRLAELAGNAYPVISKEVMQLDKHEFLYLHKDSGYRVRSEVDM